MADNCIFCDRERIKDDILYQGDGLFIKVGVGIATPGHVMIISNDHLSCFAEMSDDLWDEYDNLSKYLVSSIRETFREPFSIEYGIWKQTVPHAHTHFIPLRSSNYNLESFIGGVKESKKISIEEADREKIRATFRTERRYVTIGEKGKLYVCYIPNLPDAEILPYLDFRLSLNRVGANLPNTWKSMSELDRKRDEEKRRVTKQKLIL